VLRFFFSALVHKFSPFAALTICSALTAVGLFWLGSLHAGTPVIVAFFAATLFGVGKTFFWPTMLGVTSELFPRGGALLLGIMGGAGMLSVGLVLPIMGAKFDSLGAGAALSSVAILPIILTVVFGAVYIGFRLKGGYRAIHIGEEGPASKSAKPELSQA
jgi:MFS family permease